MFTNFRNGISTPSNVKNNNNKIKNKIKNKQNGLKKSKIKTRPANNLTLLQKTSRKQSVQNLAKTNHQIWRLSQINQ